MRCDNLLKRIMKVQGNKQQRSNPSVQLYDEEIRYLSKKEVALESWPKEMKVIFLKKLMKEEETFKLLLFLIGNGCSPDLIRRMIMLAQYWRTSWQQAQKGAQKEDHILNNMDQKRTLWFCNGQK